MKKFSSFLVSGLLAILLTGCSAPQKPTPPTLPPPTSQSPDTAPPVSSGAVSSEKDNTPLLLGNPSQAGTDPNNLLLEREAHSLSYNAKEGGPNWAAWHLDASDLGPAARSNFMPDPLLAKEFQIRPTDYRGSGYDRGHIVPSGDRTRDSAYNQQTFVMSNMLPQAPALNQFVWKKLEDYERVLAKTGSELYIYAGGSGSAGRIANSKVNVPAVCWKIIVVLPEGDNDLARINENTRVIAVSMPNREREEIRKSRWPQWTTSVAQLEQTTGYDFLSALPDKIERVLEQKIDAGRSGAAPKAPRATPSSQQSKKPPANSSELVWVNTNSGIYHLPGAQHYGKTKKGKYLTEQEAKARGYRASKSPS